MTPEMINAALGVGIIFVGFVIWLARLESLVKYREKECAQNTDQLREKIKEQKVDFEKQILELKQSHATQMSDLGKEMKEVSRVMNEILQSVSKIQGNIEGSSKREVHP